MNTVFGRRATAIPHEGSPVPLAVGVAAVTLATTCGLLIGAGHVALVCAAVLGGVGCAAVVAQPERAALALVAAVPFLVYPVSAGSLSIFLGLPLSLLVAMALLLRSTGVVAERRPVFPAFAFGALVGIGVLSAAVSAQPTTAASRVLYLVMFGVLAASLAQAMARGLIAPRRLVEALVVGAALAAVAVIGQTLVQFAVGRDALTEWLVSVSSLFGGQRSAGIAQEANWYVPSLHMMRGVLPFMSAPSAGQYMMLGLVAAVWLRRLPRASEGVFRWETLAVALIAAGLVATLSRQAWLGALVGLLMLSLERRRIRSRVTMLCVALAVALVPVPDGSGRTFGDYLFAAGNVQTKSNAERIGLWRQAIDLTSENPILGVGPGLVGTLNPDTTNTVYYAHNAVLDMAVETGIPGALAFLAVLLGGLALAWRNRSRVALGLIAAYAVANTFDDVVYFPRNGIFMAAAFALAALPGGRPAREADSRRGRHVPRRAALVAGQAASAHSTAPPPAVVAAPASSVGPISSPAPVPAQAAAFIAHTVDPSKVTPLLLGKGWFPDQEGGLNRYLRNLTEALGEPPAVVVGPAADAPPTVRATGVHNAPLWRRLTGFTRATLVRASSADLVDAHFALYAFAPVLLGLRGKPLVVHFHGPWGDESVAAGRASRAKATVQRGMERVVFRRATAAIVLSNAFKDLLVRRYGMPPELVRVVRPGVDLERFSPGDREKDRRRLGLPSGRPVVVTARRLVPRMGIDILIESWREVAANTDGAARPLLLVVGEGQQRAALEARVQRLGLGPDVRFLGKISDTDLVAAYRAADIAVAPSISLEGFGLVTLEALACGTPVIATAIGGLPEALEGLDSGLVVPPRDPAALAARLMGALHGHEPLPSRERCREYAEGFTWQRTAGEVEDVYRSVVAASLRR